MFGGQMSHEIKPRLGSQGLEKNAERNAEGLIPEVIDGRLPQGGLKEGLFLDFCHCPSAQEVASSVYGADEG
jgi:hypothetical protein